MSYNLCIVLLGPKKLILAFSVHFLWLLVLVLLLLGVLVVCIIRNRRAAAASEREYNMEASQMQGPPTIIATEYNRHSGPSPVYSADGHPKSAQFAIGSGHLSPQPPQMTGPSFPATVHHNNNYNESQKYLNQTAPVHQVSFPDQPYPSSGYSPVSNFIDEITLD